MNFKNLLFLISILAMGTWASAQDRHFTLYNMSPVSLNPGHTGAFEGTARVGGIFRDQAFTGFGVNEYVTPSFYIDAPVLMVRKRDWVGVGFFFYSDKAGSLNLGTSGGALSAAYHLSLNKKSTNTLSLGFQYGKFSRKIDAVSKDDVEDFSDTRARPTNQSSGGGSGGKNKKPGFTDLNVGLLYKSILNKTSSLEMGFAVAHVNSPFKNYSAVSSSQDSTRGKRLARLWRVHGTYNTKLNDKWGLSPSLFFQTESGATEIVTQVVANTKVGKEKQYQLNMGLGYRFGDALEVLFGFENKDLKVWMGYDITLSSLNNANKTVGGVEFAAQYLLKIYKEPEITPVIICPEY